MLLLEARHAELADALDSGEEIRSTFDATAGKAGQLWRLHVGWNVSAPLEN